jgi:hypothetical protein
VEQQEDVLWRGRVSFHEDDFGDASIFPEIARQTKFSLGRKGLTGGELRIETSGIQWHAGSGLTPRGQLCGSFHLPWEAIRSMEANRMSFSLPVGGSLVIHLTNGSEIRGEFLGSLKQLREVISNCPVAPEA